MRTTTYKCDRCHKEATDNDMDLDNVWLAWGRHGYGAHSLPPPSEWCRDCRVATGIQKPSLDSPVKPPPEPLTLEDILREFIQEEVADAMPQ